MQGFQAIFVASFSFFSFLPPNQQSRSSLSYPVIPSKIILFILSKYLESLEIIYENVL